MINFGKILERAWRILWNYRVLWIFGTLLALTSGGSGSPNVNYQVGSGENFDFGRWSGSPELRQFGNWLDQNIGPLVRNPGEHIGTILWIGLGFFLFVLVTSTIMAAIRYVSETAVLRMVDDHEATGVKVTFKQGWRLGWSRRAFRLWVIDLIINLPAILLSFIFALVVIYGIFLGIKSGKEELQALGVLGFIAVFLIFILLLVVGYAFLGLLRQFFARKAALEDASIGESFRSGWRMFIAHWKDASLLWLVMAAVGIGVGILGFFAFFLLIPVYLIMLIPAVLIGAVPGLIAFGIPSLFTSGPLTWIIGIIFALPLFMMILFLPLFFLTGWYKLFTSIAWTLAYRDLKTGEAGPAQPALSMSEQSN